MIFQLMFKTPDVTDQVEVPEGEDKEALQSIVAKWIEYGELIRVEFDTEKGTATVLEA